MFLLSINIDDLEAASLFLSPLFGLAGVWLGARLDRQATLEAAREEREHASRREILQRKEEAAKQLDEAVQEAQRDIPNTVLASEAGEQLSLISVELLQAFTRSAVLDDTEIERRFFALHMTLQLAMRARRWQRGEYPDPELNLFALTVATRDLREALTYVLRREQIPSGNYPTSKELVQIFHKDGKHDFGEINEWLWEHDILV